MIDGCLCASLTVLRGNVYGTIVRPGNASHRPERQYNALAVLRRQSLHRNASQLDGMAQVDVDLSVVVFFGVYSRHQRQDLRPLA